MHRRGRPSQIVDLHRTPAMLGLPPKFNFRPKAELLNMTKDCAIVLRTNRSGPQPAGVDQGELAQLGALLSGRQVVTGSSPVFSIGGLVSAGARRCRKPLGRVRISYPPLLVSRSLGRGGQPGPLAQLVRAPA